MTGSNDCPIGPMTAPGLLHHGRGIDMPLLCVRRAWTGRCPMRDSNRSFGLLIGGILLFVSGLHYWKYRPDFFAWLIIGLAFVAVGLLMPRTLAPLRRLWLKFGHLMSIVVSPIIL